jgi:hypothetical protein
VAGGGIFMIRDGLLTVLDEAAFENEEVFQKVLADYPAVLAGGATTEGGDGELLLIHREQGIPTAIGGTAVLASIISSSTVPASR